MLCRNYLWLLCAACLSSVYCSAQNVYEGCIDFRGRPVASVPNHSLMDVAAADYTWNGEPVIFYNPQALLWLSPQTKVFFYAHECGHHVLAHKVRNIPLLQEQEADCWGIKTLYDAGRLSDEDVVAIQADLVRAAPGDWYHLPGPMRAINLVHCLKQGSIVYRQSH